MTKKGRVLPQKVSAAHFHKAIKWHRVENKSIRYAEVLLDVVLVSVNYRNASYKVQLIAYKVLQKRNNRPVIKLNV